MLERMLVTVVAGYGDFDIFGGSCPGLVCFRLWVLELFCWLLRVCRDLPAGD